jgi:hypothetical protein
MLIRFKDIDREADMGDSKEQPHNSDTMARFKILIEDLPSHFKRASEGQQEKLMDFLENWGHTLRRKFSRKPCSLSVDFAVADRAFVSMFRNISAGGAFIERANGIAVGQQTTLAFWLPTLPRPTKLKGEVAWKSSQGFGVRFATTPYSEAGLEKAIERF